MGEADGRRWPITIQVCDDCSERFGHVVPAERCRNPQAGHRWSKVEVAPVAVEEELREALAVYADESNWHWNGIFHPRHPDEKYEPERGERARRALASSPLAAGPRKDKD